MEHLFDNMFIELQMKNIYEIASDILDEYVNNYAYTDEENEMFDSCRHFVSAYERNLLES